MEITAQYSLTKRKAATLEITNPREPPLNPLGVGGQTF